MTGPVLTQCPHCSAVLGAVDRWRRRCRRCDREIATEPAGPPAAESTPPAPAPQTEPGLVHPPVPAADAAGGELAALRHLLEEVRHQRDYLEQQLAVLQSHYESAVRERAELTHLVSQLLQRIEVGGRTPVEGEARLQESPLPATDGRAPSTNGATPRRAARGRSQTQLH